MLSKIIDFVRTRNVIFPVFIGFILRVIGLTHSSIWHDEGYTMWLLKYNIWEIIKRTARDVHPPGYYLLAKPWVNFWGSSEFSIRFFSLIFSVGIIYLVYIIVKEIIQKRAAFWSALFVALSPFMIRFGQEARMYGVVAFFTTLATYFFVKFIKEDNKKALIGYVLAVIVAVYTQYYAFFVIISHWLILSIYTPGFWRFKWKESLQKKVYIFNVNWWLANAAIFLSYLPWFYVAYKQVTRVSTSYWIKPEWITSRTIPGSVFQFLSYSHFDLFHEGGWWGRLFFWIVFAALFLFPLIFLRKKVALKNIISIYLFGYLPMILVYVVSKIKTPIYQDRYFPFSAIGIFVLWGTAIGYLKNKKTRYALAAVLVAIMILGQFIMRQNVNHKMKQLSKSVMLQAQESDVFISGELYTFLDGAYYLGYDRLKLLSGPVDGYGETSLFYDQQGKYIINPEILNNISGRLWLIGKSDKDYFDQNKWVGWRGVTFFEEGGLRATLFTKE